jgi:hypothetical protein
MLANQVHSTGCCKYAAGVTEPPAKGFDHGMSGAILTVWECDGAHAVPAENATRSISILDTGAVHQQK